MKIHATLLSTLFLASLPALAGTPTPTTSPVPESPWSCRLALYGWAEALQGDMGVAGRTADVNLSFNDVLKHLDMAFMGAVEVGYNRWSFMADVVYADVSGSATRHNIYVHLDDKQFLGNFIVAYEAMKTDTMKFDVYAGARVNSIKSTLDISDPRLLDFHGSGSKAWVDPIIGARFQHELSNNFFVRAVGDVGGFGAASQFTWQAMAGIGYSFHEYGNLLLGYRALGTDYTNGGFTYDLIAHGPIIGYEIRF
ncbi:MAG: hypothetical protein WCO57_03415 [Verrucomicrobiota bacterium]